MVEIFSAFICGIAVIGSTIGIINIGKIENRHIRFLLTTILVPVAIFILHRTCFFETVPHCKGCVIPEDGKEYLIDANMLKNNCIHAYALFQLVLTPCIVSKINGGFKKFLYIAMILAITFVLGGFVSTVSYM